MVVCDPCSQGKPMAEWQQAVRRLHVHKLNAEGLEGFSVKTLDLCEEHYQSVIVPLEMKATK